MAVDDNGVLQRRFAALLAGVCGLGLVLQLAILQEGAARNPFALTPIQDAAVYWRWAAAIGRGELVGETPFLSAPLYPYVLGLVRALGGEIAAVWTLQVALHLGTAALLAVVGRRRFGPVAGLAGAAVYLALRDPAYFTGRVLNCSLQAFLAALVLERLTAIAENRAKGAPLTAGLALGLLCLANPAFLVGIPLVAVWIWLAGGRAAEASRRALVAAGVAVAAILPASLHNQLACGELIPISAQAGLTFYHGNRAGADGTYSPAQGVSIDRNQQNLDARLQAQAATGDDSWRGASDYFFGLGLDWWRAEPAAAARLALRKAWWFLSGREYGDIYIPTLEEEDGIASRLALAPLRVAWWTLPALVGLGLLIARRRLDSFPELLVLGIPFLVVTVFWYSPRYRMPAVPVIALLAAPSLLAIFEWRKAPIVAALSVLALVGSLSLSRLDPKADRAETFRPHYELVLGDVYLRDDDTANARVHFERALALGNKAAATALGEVLRRAGDSEAAIAHLRGIVAQRPGSAFALRSLAVALAEAGREAEAGPYFERVLALDPNDKQAESALGNVKLALGHAAEALGHYDRALAIDPDFHTARYNRAVALESLGRRSEAMDALREILRRRPGHAHAQARLDALLASPGGSGDG